ncbi:DUF6311 domain-containing protein [Pararoseomonas sp. SCSIO 73927]|uniref:DUF6311 domain-containing protein n=1 Tax=Pararoseomonas sp. SCSIO 73927 TaxID=3114537 RepID=UPI0030CEA5C2
MNTTAQTDAPGSRAPAILTYGIALALGLVLALYVFPLPFLFPHGEVVMNESDATQHAVGQRYFIAEPWGWPLLQIRTLLPPDGLPLGFMDGIPILALVLKAVRGILPQGFHGVGLWYGLAWVLQPVAAVFCLRAAGEKRLLPALAFMMLAVAMPAWWARYGHAALSGHFILLLGLGTYFHLLSPRPAGTMLWRWLGAVALVLGALLTHPYLAVMTMALVLAAPATLVWRGLSSLRAAAPAGRLAAWRPALLAAAGGIGTVVAAQLLISALGYDQAIGGGGYGLYAMNLLSPVWPFWSGLLPNPSSFAELPNAAGWESYNWLGLGVIAAVPLGVLLHPRAAALGMRRHLGLVLALLGLTAMAVSTKVGLGSRLVLDLGDPPKALESFRASGRLFWPVAYALALAGVLLLARLRPVALRAAALAAVVAVQWMDVAPVRDRLIASVEHVPALAPETRALRQILPTATAITMLPSWFCWSSEVTATAHPMMMEFLGLASERALPVNTVFPARLPRPVPCSDDIPRATAPLRAGEVRIFTNPGDGDWITLRPEGPHRCEKVERVVFCRRPDEVFPRVESAPLSGGLDFRLNGNGASSMEAGWRVLGEGWTWSGGSDAALLLRRDAGAAGPLRLVFEAIGFAPPGRASQRVTVRTEDGAVQGEWELPHMTFTQPVLDVPAGAGPLRLLFHFERPSSPVEIGMSADPRIYAMGLRGLRAEPR